MSGEGWDIRGSLQVLRGKIDPYLWEQGQELARRGAVEDFAIRADGNVQVKVSDPRDTRRFWVTITRQADGRVVAACACPYRLEGCCRHQVVALEYLRGVSEGEIAAERPAAPEEPEAAAGAAGLDAAEAGTALDGEGPVLWRLYGAGVEVATRPDGSLLRVVLQSLGSSRRRHRVALQLYTGTGWTELRTGDAARWIDRGGRGAHPRDQLLVELLRDDGGLRREVGSETLGVLLRTLAGTDALVDRAGQAIPVSLAPWRLAARLVRRGERGIGCELRCRPGERPGERGAGGPGGAEEAADDEEVSDGGRDLEEVAVVPSVAPWIQLESGRFVPLVCGGPGLWVERLQEDDLDALAAEDTDRFLREGLELLSRMVRGELGTEPGLIREVEGVDAARLVLEGRPERLAGRLELSYGGEWVVAPETPEPWSVERQGEIVRYPPAGQSLARARSELEALGFRREDGHWVLEGPGSLARVLGPRPRAFVSLVLPAALESLDLVDRAPVLRLAVDAPSGGGAPGLPAPAGAPAGDGPAGDGGTFRGTGAGGGLGLGALEASWSLVDGDRELPVDLEALRHASERDPQGRLTLEDGSVLSLAHPAVRRLAGIAGAGAGEAADEEPAPGRVRLSLAELSELVEVEASPELALDFQGRVRGLVAALRHGEGLPDPGLDPEVEGVLRPYQREAVRWFRGLGVQGLGGVLADEMGLGKTLMALAHLFGLPEGGNGGNAAGEGAAGEDAAGDHPPVLVVCPTSLVFNWLDECRRFFPGVRVRGLQGLSAAVREETIAAGADLLVTSYALLRRDHDALAARPFRAVVLDEGQYIKNAESRTARAAFDLVATERWILTGTPVENHLGELWSLFRFLVPGLLGERRTFRERVEEPARRGDREALERLRARVRPFILRRTKEQVLGELPPRIEQVERVTMTSVQRRLYEEQLARARGELEGELEGGDTPQARFKILAALTRLRQICCHPDLLEEGREESGDATGDRMRSGKLDLLLELLEECADEGHRVLLFSQFTSMLDIIEEALGEAGLRNARLDGSTRDREAVVRRFREDAEIPVFLISLKAGGHGLNLTEADTVILYDPWWNPATEEQAAARAHRMGQTLPVHVHKLIAAGTVEERILELQARKRDLAASVVGDEGEGLEGLDLDELRGLLVEGP